MIRARLLGTSSARGDALHRARSDQKAASGASAQQSDATPKPLTPSAIPAAAEGVTE